jgi:hypothetical protein
MHQCISNNSSSVFTRIRLHSSPSAECITKQKIQVHYNIFSVYLMKVKYLMCMNKTQHEVSNACPFPS